jgi:hypothetical protein
MNASIDSVVQVPPVGRNGLLDYRWLRVLKALEGSVAPAGTGFVEDGTSLSYAPMVLFQGPASALPGSPDVGSIYYALDTGAIYWANGTSWTRLSEELTGDVTKPSNSNVTSLANVFFSPGTYGGPTLTPILTIDSKGRVTNLTFETITAVATPGGLDTELQFNQAGALGGTAGITYNFANQTLSFTNKVGNFNNLSPNIVKGDITAHTGTSNVRLPVGTEGQFLRVNSSTTTGLVWADDNTIEVRFNYGDATPKPIGTVPANRVVRQTTITILTPFDDPSATLALGAPADLQATTDNFPQDAGVYTTYPGLQYGVNTAVALTISPGTSSQGAGLVSITLEE